MEALVGMKDGVVLQQNFPLRMKMRMKLPAVPRSMMMAPTRQKAAQDS